MMMPSVCNQFTNVSMVGRVAAEHLHVMCYSTAVVVLCCGTYMICSRPLVGTKKAGHSCPVVGCSRLSNCCYLCFAALTRRIRNDSVELQHLLLAASCAQQEVGEVCEVLNDVPNDLFCYQMALPFHT
jgi:hypothetical protein